MLFNKFSLLLNNRTEDQYTNVEKKNSPTEEKEEKEDSEPKAKRQKVEAEASTVDEELVKKKADNDLTVETETEATTDEANKAAKKKRKQNSSFSDEINQEAQSLSLQVIAK